MTLSGNALVQARHIPRQSAWVWRPQDYPSLSGGEFVKAVKVRCNALKTVERANRGKTRTESKKCPTCRDVNHSLGHILQSCPMTHGLRVKRHDCIVDKLKSKLEREGHTVIKEPRIGVRGTFLKPDLICLKGGEALVLDPTIVADNCDLDLAAIQKAKLYSCKEVEKFCTDRGTRTFRSAGLVVNWRGLWQPESWNQLRALGVGERLLNLWSTQVLVYGWKMWKLTTDRTGFRG